MRNKRVIKNIWYCIPLFLFIGFVNLQLEWFSFHLYPHDFDYDLRVMSWNVGCPDGASGDRQKEIAKVIFGQDADVVLINEFRADSCVILDSILRTRYEYSEDVNSLRVCGDIMYSNRRIYDSGHIRIPVNGKKVPNIAFSIPVANDYVRIIGVHLKSNNDLQHSNVLTDVSRLANLGDYYNAYKDAQRERCFSAIWLKQWVKERKHPTIVMGDMNDFSFSAPMDSLSDAGMKDSWWEGGFGIGNTFHTGLMHLRIDHIYHSKELELVNVWVVDTDLSDHCPLVADFKIR